LSLEVVRTGDDAGTRDLFHRFRVRASGICTERQRVRNGCLNRDSLPGFQQVRIRKDSEEFLRHILASADSKKVRETTRED
jgi:hypothetical protein